MRRAGHPASSHAGILSVLDVARVASERYLELLDRVAFAQCSMQRPRDAQVLQRQRPGQTLAQAGPRTRVLGLQRVGQCLQSIGRHRRVVAVPGLTHDFAASALHRLRRVLQDVPARVYVLPTSPEGAPDSQQLGLRQLDGPQVAGRGLEADLNGPEG